VSVLPFLHPFYNQIHRLIDKSIANLKPETFEMENKEPGNLLENLNTEQKLSDEYDNVQNQFNQIIN
jgi:hypothetical protein